MAAKAKADENLQQNRTKCTNKNLVNVEATKTMTTSTKQRKHKIINHYTCKKDSWTLTASNKTNIVAVKMNFFRKIERTTRMDIRNEIVENVRMIKYKVNRIRIRHWQKPFELLVPRMYI